MDTKQKAGRLQYTKAFHIIGVSWCFVVLHTSVPSKMKDKLPYLCYLNSVKKQKDVTWVSSETIFTIFGYTALISLPGHLNWSHIWVRLRGREGSPTGLVWVLLGLIILLLFTVFGGRLRYFMEPVAGSDMGLITEALWPWPLVSKYSLFENQLPASCWALDIEWPWNSSPSS